MTTLTGNGRKRWCVLAGAAMLSGVVTLLAGCGTEKVTPTAAAEAPRDASAPSLPGNLFLTVAPEGGIVPVSKLKEDATEGDEAVVRVVVGGRKTPFVAGRAVWTAVDAELPNACTRTGHACPAPWDYCCAASETLNPNLLTIQVLGDNGRPLAVDLNGSDTIKPLDTLVVRGIVAARPNAEALVLNATGIYVETKPQG